MTTTSTYITTGNAAGNLVSTLASNGYDINPNPSLDNPIARVLSVNDDRTITFEILNNNLSPSLLYLSASNDTLAKPLNLHMMRLPVEGELVMLTNIPDPFSTSDNPAQSNQTICYIGPLPSWQDINNNIIQNNNIVSNTNNVDANISSYKQSTLGFT